MTDQRKTGSISVLLLVIVAGLLAWAVITHPLAQYVSSIAPEAALGLTSGNSDALLNLADEKLGLNPLARDLPPHDVNEASKLSHLSAAAKAIRARGVPVPMVAPEMTDAVRKQVRAAAEQALQHNPFDARALRILGQVADTDAQTTLYMQRAVAMSKHEALALYWLLQNAFLQQDYAGAVRYSDILLRSKPQFNLIIVPILAEIAEAKGGMAIVSAALKTNPPWRRLFFYALTSSIHDARTPMRLFLALKSDSMAPTNEEIGFYVSFLMANKLYDLAYYTWAQFLTTDQLANLGLLFDGNFHFAPATLPFGWEINNGDGVRIDVVPRANTPGRNALYLDFIDGEVRDARVEQVVTLAPGSYHFNGKERGDIRAPRGLRWHVSCFETPTTALASSAAFVGATPEWTPFIVDFTVPPKQCGAQRVWLALDARSRSERLVSGHAAFAELSITH